MMTMTTTKTMTTLIRQTCFLAILLLPHLTSSTSNFNNYNAYHYDMTTPQFTPDGRLLQVEYASRAADHSFPLVLFRQNDITFLVTYGNRWISHHDTVILGMSGILADVRALLHHLSQHDDSHQQWYGTRVTDARQVAHIIGAKCQDHSFGGGLRPFGATLLVVGPHEVYQTDPSGSVIELDLTNTYYHMIGGTSEQQLLLKQHLDQIIDSESTVSIVLQNIVHAVYECHKDSTTKNSNHHEEDGNTNTKIHVALVSPNLGVYQLTNTQVKELLQRQHLVDKKDAKQ